MNMRSFLRSHKDLWPLLLQLLLYMRTRRSIDDQVSTMQILACEESQLILRIHL